MKKFLSAVFLSTVVCVGSAAANTGEANVSPLGLIAGAINGNVLFPLNDQLMVGPSGSYWGLTVNDTSIQAIGIGGRAEYHVAGLFENGLYAAGLANFAQVSATDDTCSATSSGFAVGGIGGYGWYWDNNVSSKLGAGYSIGSFGDITGDCDDGSSYTYDSSLPVGGLALEWSLGYRF